MPAVSRLGLYMKLYGPTREGFTPLRAKTWLNMQKKDDEEHANIPASERKRAHRLGFTSEEAENLGVTEENAGQFISQRDYLYLYPLNGQYIKWLADAVTIRSIFKPFADHLTPCFYQFQMRDGELFIIALPDLPDGYDVGLDSVLKLIQDQGSVELIHARRNRHIYISYDEGSYYLNDKKNISKKELEALLMKYAPVSVMRAVLPGYLKTDPGDRFNQLELYIINEYGDSPMIGQAFMQRKRVLDPLDVFSGDLEGETDGEEEIRDEIDDHDDMDLSSSQMSRKDFSDAIRYIRCDLTENEAVSPVDLTDGTYRLEDGHVEEISCWKEIVSYVERLCRFAPQLEYFDIRILLTDDGKGFMVTRMTNTPPFPVTAPFSEVLHRYLARKLEEKKRAYADPAARRKRGLHKAGLKTRKVFTKMLYPEGMKPYLGVTWIHDVFYDLFFDHSVSLPDKLWGYKHGFFSYRLPQYGITKENHLSYISDFEYKWMRHINSRYRTWLEDKITVKYIASDYKECFPEYYYYTVRKNNLNKIIAMMDLPEDYGTEPKDIFRLVKEKGDLALKMVSGSHGDGFYRFSFKDGEYLLNGKPTTEDEIEGIIMNPDSQYLITEFIKSHPELSKYYDGAVSTLRFIVFKKDGRTPEMADCYMRVGTSATGAVDNIGAGGMFVKVEMKDGHYSDAALMVNNNIIPTPYHPDSGLLVEGYIPNWDKVCRLILDVAASIPQLEYLGVDAAITPDGVKFPEINRYPDFPRMDELSRPTLDYLLGKLQKKKERFGYDLSRPHRLITLPKR